MGDITDPKCRVALTDFGTAIELDSYERLCEPVGTQNFWAPEFYDRNYGMKVDIWAMGVSMFGIVDGNFPFKDEAAVRKKEPRMPRGLHPTCSDFIMQMLHKDEAKRCSAACLIAHKWICSSSFLDTVGAHHQKTKPVSWDSPRSCGRESTDSLASVSTD